MYNLSGHNHLKVATMNYVTKSLKKKAFLLANEKYTFLGEFIFFMYTLLGEYKIENLLLHNFFNIEMLC